MPNNFVRFSLILIVGLLISACNQTEIIDRVEVNDEIYFDECNFRGLVTVLPTDFYIQTDDGKCIESRERKTVATICIDCGDGICEGGQESVCNCPSDCDPDNIKGDINSLDLEFIE